MTRIGITGGTGYVGGRLLQRLVSHGFGVRLVDDGSGPVRAEDPAFPPLREDFASPRSLGWLTGCDLLVHLAARSGVMACAEDPGGTWKINVDGTRRLVGWARERRIPLVFASSFSVVGIPERWPIREAAPARPTHEYARQKAAGEELVRSLRDPGGALGAILRLSNVYGRYEVDGRRVAKGNVLNLFAEEARSGRPLPVFAPGTQRRDYVHLDDVVAHVEAALAYLRKDGRPAEVPTFNVASGESVTVRDLARRIEATWHALHPERPPLSSEVVPNPRGEVEILHPEFAVDATWTERALGLRCQVGLAKGIEEMLSEGLPPAGTPPG